MFDRSELVLSSTDSKLLYDIRQLLAEIKELLVCPSREGIAAEGLELVDTPEAYRPDRLEKMTRVELVDLVKALPNRPSGRWQCLPSAKLIDLLRKEGV